MRLRAAVQVGDLPKPGSAPIAAAEPTYALQGVSHDTLTDAAAWVKQWPEARGLTHLLPALLLCRSAWADIDSIYLFSDGIVDDAGAVMSLVREVTSGAAAAMGSTARRRGLGGGAGGVAETAVRVPVVHTVGFFAQGRSARGPAFLQALADATGGSFQEYDPRRQQVYVDGELRPFDSARETEEERMEREWVEARLAAERWAMAREGRKEDLETTMGRVRTSWHMERLLPARHRGDEGRGAYEAERAAVAERNAERVESARAAQIAEARAAWEAAAAAAKEEATAAAAAHEARRRSWLAEARERRAAATAAAAAAAADAAAAAVVANAAAESLSSAVSLTVSTEKAAARRRSRSRSRTRSLSINTTRTAVRAASKAARKAERAARRAQEAAVRAEARCAAPYVSIAEAAERARKLLEEEAARPPKPPSQRTLMQRQYEAELKAVCDHNRRCGAS